MGYYIHYEHQLSCTVTSVYTVLMHVSLSWDYNGTKKGNNCSHKLFNKVNKRYCIECAPLIMEILLSCYAITERYILNKDPAPTEIRRPFGQIKGWANYLSTAASWKVKGQRVGQAGLIRNRYTGEGILLTQTVRRHGNCGQMPGWRRSQSPLGYSS